MGFRFWRPNSNPTNTVEAALVMANAAKRLPFVNAVSGPLPGRFPLSFAVKRPFVSGKAPVKTPFPAFPPFNGGVSAKATAHSNGKRGDKGEKGGAKAVSSFSALSGLTVKTPFNRVDTGRLIRAVSLSGNRSAGLSAKRPGKAETAVNSEGVSGPFRRSRTVSQERPNGRLRKGSRLRDRFPGKGHRLFALSAFFVNRETPFAGKRGVFPQNTPFGITHSTASLSRKRGDSRATVTLNAQKHPLAVAAGIGGAS